MSPIPKSIVGLSVTHLDGYVGRITKDVGVGPYTGERVFVVSWEGGSHPAIMQASYLRYNGRPVLEIVSQISLYQAAIRKKKAVALKELDRLLEAADFTGADDHFSENCRDYMESAEYTARREKAVAGHRERRKREEEVRIAFEKKALREEVLRMLNDFDLDAADGKYREKCSGWWDGSEYEHHRSRAVAIHLIVEKYKDCTLKELNALLADKHLGLSPEEIAVLKLPKLDGYLARIGLQLDHEQRLACARPENNLLIRARAGSGKTRTLATIATLAMRDEKLDPNQVMILAFNKKAAQEIGERVCTTSGIAEYRNARTFHSLAYQLADHQGRNLVFDDGNLQPSRRKQSRFVERVIHAVLNPAFREKLYEFFRRELEQIDRIGSALVGEEYLEFRRAMTDFSLGGHNVKSNGEKFIADFLFEHGINFEYEKAWSWQKLDHLQGSPYRPDFSLTANGKDLIWEHWGIDPNDPGAEVPKWWKTCTGDYREQIEAKRRYCEQRGIRLIETHAGMLRDGREVFERRLKALLGEHGIESRKLDHAILVDRVAEAPRTISRMAGLFLGFISRAKKRGWSVERVAREIHEFPDAEPRNRVFHELAVRAYAEYEKLLAEERAWDFDDMLISATEQVRTHGGLAEIGLGRHASMRLSGLRWVLIDEFQDFSELYYRLIRAILAANPEIRVVAVGDDWQAINGFAGAQLSFFDNFDGYFDNAGTASIATNYRSDRAIVGAGNKVMQGRGQAARTNNEWNGDVQAHVVKNSDRITGDDVVGQLCLDAASDDATGKVDYDLAKALKACADFIGDSAFEQDGSRWLPSVLLLARTSRAYGLEHEAFKRRLLRVLERHPELQDIANDIELEVMTVHRAKGKEAHTVIVLDATAKQFPKVHADNQLFRPFGVTVEDVLAEERRLFYVAVTRSQQRLMLLSGAGDASPYLVELDLQKNRGISLIESMDCKDIRAPDLGETARLIQQYLKR